MLPPPGVSLRGNSQTDCLVQEAAFKEKKGNAYWQQGVFRKLKYNHQGLSLQPSALNDPALNARKQSTAWNSKVRDFSLTFS